MGVIVGQDREAPVIKRRLQSEGIIRYRQEFIVISLLNHIYIKINLMTE